MTHNKSIQDNILLRSDVGFIRKAVGRDRNGKCTRCEGPWLIAHDPDKTWGDDGKLCNDCYSHVKKGIQEYEAVYLGGYSNLPIELEGWLFVYIFDERNKVIFKPKKKSKYALQIPTDLLTDCKIITKSEASIKKAILTAGLLKSSEKKYLQIDFVGEYNKTELAVFEVQDKLEEANNTIRSYSQMFQLIVTENSHEPFFPHPVSQVMNKLE